MQLALAEHCVFENFSNTNEPLRWQYHDKPKRGPGRPRRPPIAENTLKEFDKAKAEGFTDHEAAQHLISKGKIDSTNERTLVRYIKKKNARRLFQEEQDRRFLETVEAFKDAQTD